MINEEIIYDRTLTGSTMKVIAKDNAQFDEKILLKRKLPGLLPVEKCFVDGKGQYWYNISGKQSLESYCNALDLKIDFVRRMIISICNEIEILERNLVDENCIVLNPKFIFISNSNNEVIFTAYPGNERKIDEEFRDLMEFVITKIDHSDNMAVESAYEIYNKSMDDAYTLFDIKESILKYKDKKADTGAKPVIIQENNGVSVYSSGEDTTYEYKEENFMPQKSMVAEEITGYHVEKKPSLIKEKKSPKNKKSQKKSKIKSQPAQVKTPKSKSKDGIVDKVKKILTATPETIFKPKTKNPADLKKGIPMELKNSNESFYVSPDMEIEREKEPEYHPTVCLSDYIDKPQGILLYEGTESMENIELKQLVMEIGQSKKADAKICKETVSHLHARIEQNGSEYYIEDLNSTNGTFINGEILSYKDKKKLKRNDIIKFADVKYRFV